MVTVVVDNIVAVDVDDGGQPKTAGHGQQHTPLVPVHLQPGQQHHSCTCIG